MRLFWVGGHLKSRSGYAAFELYNSIDRELSFYGVLEEELWYGEVVLREEMWEGYRLDFILTYINPYAR